MQATLEPYLRPVEWPRDNPEVYPENFESRRMIGASSIKLQYCFGKSSGGRSRKR
jgi:hypothetical protein